MRFTLIFILKLTILTMIAFGVVNAAPVTTTQIIEKVTQAALKNPTSNFLNYKVEGMCFWEHHDKWGFPYITSTLKVEHFLPDAVITVFDQYGDNPWFMANKWIDPGMKRIGDEIYQKKMGSRFKKTAFAGADNNSMEKFKEVDVIGDPGLLVMRLFPMISSMATEFVPYYSSLADAYFWRSPALENMLYPQYLLPGVRTEGSLVDQWGNIFPRIGYINQLGDYKAAAVIALRAADIATNGAQLRMVKTLHSGNCGWSHCHVWPSHENDFKDVKFQEIYPKLSIRVRKIFGVNDLFSSQTYGQDQYKLGHGNYVWVMWRHYKGCIGDDGKFLWETSW